MKLQVAFLQAVLVSSLVAAAAVAADRSAPADGAPVGDRPAVQATAVPADRATAPAPATAPELRYGPIQARDPGVRAQIKQLYRQQDELDRAAQARLAELGAALQAEADGDLRFRIQQEMVQVKKDLQVHSVELGLEIAGLNEDVRRVEEYEKALDQLLHPEKYLPATLDPSIARDRARQMGLEN